MRRFILILLLSAGVIAGYGSAFHGHSHGAWAHGPCHQQTPAPVPVTSPPEH